MELDENAKRDAMVPLPTAKHPLHEHPLTKSLSHYGACGCDNCNNGVEHGQIVFSCTSCEFDLCEHCFFNPNDVPNSESESENESEIDNDKND